MGEHRRKLVSSYFVNCWHMNEHESAAMWRLYSQADEAICVQSTFARLADAVQLVFRDPVAGNQRVEPKMDPSPSKGQGREIET
jgi:hypothetical protein